MRNFRGIFKSMLLKGVMLVPPLRKYLQEKTFLYAKSQQQEESIRELEKQARSLKNVIQQKSDPKLQPEYKFATNNSFQITKFDLQKSQQATSQSITEPKTANWFIPPFEHISFGGLYTIFRVILRLSQDGVLNRIIIYGKDSNINVSVIRKEIDSNFKFDYDLITFDQETQQVDELPASDISFCTLWDSAYILLKFNNTKRKYYFIQDYEPLFYPAGSISALIESTYRFGFIGIVNTQGLLDDLQTRHKLNGISFTPAVDHNIYYPPRERRVSNKVRVFFYARPNRQRNGFELGVEVIRQLKNKYKNRIEIITAGSMWDESEYDLKGVVTNLQLIKTIKEVAELYRSCDIGFCYMLTRHPSYQPLEFMASGMATVTNMNESNLWLLKNNQNCLIGEPSPSSMVEQISILIENPKLRGKIVKSSINFIKGTSWDKQLEDVVSRIMANSL